jgi:hypothetical protein
LAIALCHVKASEVLSQLLSEVGCPDGPSAPEIVIEDRRRTVTGVRAHPDAFRVRPMVKR